LPLTHQRVDSWLELYDRERNATDENTESDQTTLLNSELPNISST